MNELRRLVYLQALGVDGYVSRSQLPGAAATRRLAIVPASPGAQAIAGKLKEPATPGRQPVPAIAMPRVETAAGAPVAAAVEALPTRDQQALRFSLAAVTCGGWLWLEELEGAPFTAPQLQLVQAMAGALGRLDGDGEAGRGPAADAGALLTQFDWPMHSNLQLDLGQEAAGASVAAFIRRKLEQGECAGLILLGPGCEARVPLDQLDGARIVRTVSTARMLRDPLLKRQAWQDLGPICRPA
ncbi:MAG: hypothetical protein V2I26_18605 [Halieaceae bacterium]|jgi:hypothetical protein|nr:hypothetical protein [Halieaceae bacterium]